MLPPGTGDRRGLLGIELEDDRLAEAGLAAVRPERLGDGQHAPRLRIGDLGVQSRSDVPECCQLGHQGLDLNRARVGVVLDDDLDRLQPAPGMHAVQEEGVEKIVRRRGEQLAAGGDELLVPSDLPQGRVVGDPLRAARLRTKRRQVLGGLPAAERGTRRRGDEREVRDGVAVPRLLPAWARACFGKISWTWTDEVSCPSGRPVTRSRADVKRPSRPRSG
jgi:hypothetical protein